jgi:CubicO group peptidase (beta-lactamase class C family)
MQIDTVFRLASVSKPIVSAAALALVDQGKLSLDDPVTKWVVALTDTALEGMWGKFTTDVRDAVHESVR